MYESPNFKVNDEKASQSPMEEHQVNAKPFMADPQSLLPSDKRKFVAEFQQEGFKMSDERIFQFVLGVFVFETKKFEQQRIANFFISGDGIIGFRLFALQQHRS